MTTPQAKWTILTYIAAHNDLDAAGQRSMNQILATGSTPEVQLAALYDGAQGARKVIAGTPGSPAEDLPLGNFNSGDPAALVDTVKWAFQRRPAERYGLVLWSHGTGWQPEEMQRIAATVRDDSAVTRYEATQRSQGAISPALFRTTLQTILSKKTLVERAICFDNGTQQSLDTLELENVMTQIDDFIQQPLDLLGMDACVMATLEVAYQLRRHVRALVASEEVVPPTSWPFDTIFSGLHADPDMNASDLAKLVVDHYLAYYRSNPPKLNRGDVTKVALDLAAIDPVTEAVDGLAAALCADTLLDHAETLDAVQKRCVNTETREGRRLKNKFQVQLWDLGTLCRGLAQTSASPAVQNAATALVNQLAPGGFVLAEGHDGNWFDGLAGVSIYLCARSLDMYITPHYKDIALAHDTRWLQMLRAYDDEMLSR